MADNTQLRPSEAYSVPEGKSPEKSTKKDSKEFKEATRVGKEALGAIESAESFDATGEVSEANSSKKEGGNQGTISGMTYAQVKAALLKNIPSQPEMVKQIEAEVKKEIKFLHAKAMKLVAKNGSFFEINNIMKKVRELKSILAMLAKASYEALKTLWLRFVHGRV